MKGTVRYLLYFVLAKRAWWGPCWSRKPQLYRHSWRVGRWHRAPERQAWAHGAGKRQPPEPGLTRDYAKYILLCTHFYRTLNKLHDKKHPYKPIPLITTYLSNPEQPSPFVTIWALITSTWWPKKSLHDTWLCNYTFQKYFIALGGLHPFWCCHLKPALHLHMQWYFFLLFFFLFLKMYIFKEKV